MDDFSFVQLGIIFVSIIVIFYLGYAQGYVKGTIHTVQKQNFQLKEVVDKIETTVIRVYVVEDENSKCVSVYRSSDDKFLIYALSFGDISSELYATYPDDSKVYVIDKIKKFNE